MGKGIMMIIGKPKGEKSEDDGDDEKAEKEPTLSGMGSKKAAKAILAAIEAGDASALDGALKNHYEACEPSED